MFTTGYISQPGQADAGRETQAGHVTSEYITQPGQADPGQETQAGHFTPPKSFTQAGQVWP